MYVKAITTLTSGEKVKIVVAGASVLLSAKEAIAFAIKILEETETHLAEKQTWVQDLSSNDARLQKGIGCLSIYL